MLLAIGLACIYRGVHVASDDESPGHNRGFEDAQDDTTPANGTRSARVEALYNDTRGTRQEQQLRLLVLTRG